MNLSWTYDRYGNRLSQSATGSYTGTVNQPTVTVDATTNRLTSPGYSYDAAGNLWTDASGDTYSYDAEGNLIGVTGGTSATFTYDALNQRVMTVIGGTTRAYGFNLAGQRATVWDGSGNLISAQYYAGGQPLAYYLASDGHVRFQHQDWVGTERFRTTYTGAVEGSFTSLPFGDSKATASGSDTDAYHYAGLDADSADLQHAAYREVSTVQGRWLRPDPYDGSYHLRNPQSFNRYAYAGNSPISKFDHSGLEALDECASEEDCSYDEGGGGCLSDACVTADPDPPQDPDPGSCYVCSVDEPVEVNPQQPSSTTAPNNLTKLTPAQCAAAKTLLAREAQFGTPKAARMSSNTFGDNTMSPFNSTFVPNLQSPVGNIDLDWFTEVSGYGGGQYTAAIVYTGAKSIWTLGRVFSGIPVGHYVPFADPGERNAVWQSTINTRYADIFTPAFMKNSGCPS